MSADVKQIDSYFGSSRTEYGVFPRSLLQSMPKSWQSRFVKCLEELDAAASNLPGLPTEYDVRAIYDGRRKSSPYADYDRGRRRIDLKHPTLRERLLAKLQKDIKNRYKGYGPIYSDPEPFEIAWSEIRRTIQGQLQGMTNEEWESNQAAILQEWDDTAKRLKAELAAIPKSQNTPDRSPLGIRRSTVREQYHAYCAILEEAELYPDG